MFLIRRAIKLMAACSLGEMLLLNIVFYFYADFKELVMNQWNWKSSRRMKKTARALNGR